MTSQLIASNKKARAKKTKKRSRDLRQKFMKKTAAIRQPIITAP
jgi:hypothetical protein